MRTLVDIPDAEIAKLALICEAKGLSRSEVIRRAIAAYVLKNRTAPADVFGLWKSAHVDGLAYQEQARSEW
jgi:metal-responsive CopG/Arc/MetJ family transcriptional regulator